MQKILKNKNDIVVLVDYREKRSSVTKYLEKLDVKISDSTLKVGDFIISDRTVIERKTTKDFISSIIDGRLFEQTTELKNNFENPIILIEGTFNGDTNMNDNCIKAAMSSVILDKKMSLIMTKNEQDTAKMIYWLARKEQIESKREVGLRGKKKPKDEKLLQEHIISSIPNISNVTAKKLLNEFGSVKNVINASENRMKKLNGLGEKKIKKIQDILNLNYNLKKS